MQEADPTGRALGSITGPTFKLVSPADGLTLLGTLTVPAGIAQTLHNHQNVHFYLPRPLYVADRSCMVTSYFPPSPDPPRSCILTWAIGLPPGDAVILHNATPEEVEQMPGWAFSAGAAYLRSILGHG